jgi:hypothetical protein
MSVVILLRISVVVGAEAHILVIDRDIPSSRGFQRGRVNLRRGPLVREWSERVEIQDNQGADGNEVW